MREQPLENRHHILFPEKCWEVYPAGRVLRQQPSLITKIDMDLHQEIHATVPLVPVLGFHALRRTMFDYEPKENAVSSVDGLMMTIHEALKHPRTHPIERELGDLTLWALEMQRDMLR